MYASFGSQVTVLESYSELIAREDRDIAASVQEVLERKASLSPECPCSPWKVRWLSIGMP